MNVAAKEQGTNSKHVPAIAPTHGTDDMNTPAMWRISRRRRRVAAVSRIRGGAPSTFAAF
jgi:hypothetical protein